MAFPDAKDDEQRAATRALMKSLRYVESTRDAASVTELCEVIVGKMRASYHKDERPGGIVAWLSNDHMITLARQSPDPDRLYTLPSYPLARAIQAGLHPLLDESKLGRVQVSIYPRGELWGVEINFL